MEYTFYNPKSLIVVEAAVVLLKDTVGHSFGKHSSVSAYSVS